MSNYNDIRTIRAHFLDTWGATPVVLDNEPSIDEPSGIWARFSVSPGASFRQSIARRTYERQGRVYLQIMIPEGARDEDGWKLADDFAAAFTDWSSPDYMVRFEPAQAATSDREDDYFVITVTVPYRSTDL